MKLYKHSFHDDIFAMSNARGKYIVRPHNLPFSFYFSSSAGVSHGPRVKPEFNPEKLRADKAGTLKLCDDWRFIPGPDDEDVSNRDIQGMKSFFRYYIVLFCAVWDSQIDDGDVEDYFYGRIDFHEMLENFDFYEDYKEELDNLSEDIESLDKFCRDHKLVNFYGN